MKKLLLFLISTNQTTLPLETIVSTGMPDRDNYPLHYFAYTGDSDSLENLVYSGDYHVDHSDHLGRTPLHYAALNGHLATIHKLQYLGCEIHVKDSQEILPETLAFLNGHSSIYERLKFYSDLQTIRRYYAASPIEPEE